MAILDIRGTHGSGKSWIPHSLLKQYQHRVIEVEGKMEGYLINDLDCMIIGKYSTTCGGCDGVGSAEEVVRRVRKYSSAHRNVLLEGILVAHTFSRYSGLAEELVEKRYRFLFLDTPLPTCIARVRARRIRSGNAKEFNPRNVINDWNNIWRKVRQKMIEARREVYVLNHKDPLPQVLSLMD